MLSTATGKNPKKNLENCSVQKNYCMQVFKKDLCSFIGFNILYYYKMKLICLNLFWKASNRMTQV